jgi:FMN phosphatase YigB (HAD superfamily)
MSDSTTRLIIFDFDGTLADSLDPSWPDLIRPSTEKSQRMDARVKPGHDEQEKGCSRRLHRHGELVGFRPGRRYRFGA